jgi:hypothetical protein
VSTRKRDVKDGKVEDATRQPEQFAIKVINHYGDEVLKVYDVASGAD